KDSEEVKVSFKMIEDMDERERGWFRENELSVAPIDLPNHMRLRNPAMLEKLLLAIIHEFESKLPFYEWSLRGGMLQLLAYVVREYEWKLRSADNMLHYELLSDIRSYIASQAYRELSLDELSNQFHVSKFHLIRL